MHLCEVALIEALFTLEKLETDKEIRHKPGNKSEAKPHFERSTRSRQANGTGVTNSSKSQNKYGHTAHLENLFKGLNVQDQSLARHAKNKFKN